MPKPRRTMPIMLTSLLLVICCLLSPASAGVLLDNTNQGSATLDPQSGYTLGYSSGSTQVRGVQFTATANLDLTSLQVGLKKGESIVNTLTATLYLVDSSISVLKSASISTSGLTATPSWESIDLSGFSVEASKTYILGLYSSSTGTAYLEWVKTTSPTLPTGTSGLTFDSYKSLVNGTWSNSSTNASFYLQGTPSGASVPEPAAIALAVIGAGSMMTRRLLLRRHSKS